ncbi:NAD(P)-binding domain-containing protein [Candidatus Woesearchaeota archaeon]|jgi:pyrroline-5-carboxylate reductase|nr:NAD(P)-binding domain-containing protein [Candidatus Woesearchaeota archaeon]MBT4111338.1 NAD(P)-binding domain-containing protein [Candidatus Woesearchaeota archaeon]MBT4336483.1 NAD(P)-binding domain-containing protein [Candidatus Woesearchaeota archaeon]MBT4469896.1 NAD(P)-binding domain-containing protein [Candidatus Woesearchaeota archaeon]MBT6744433.1 NAD(P)-binding domain-containing protein [Candidatus Woesearchaeota archaeon]
MIVFLVSDKTISVVGAGYLGTKVIDALKKKGHQRIIAARRNLERLEKLQQQYGIEVSNNNVYAVKNSDVVILGLKPNSLDDVCEEIKYSAKDKLVISLAAGKSIANIESILDQSRVCRVMTGIFVSDEIAAYALGSKTTEEDEAIVKYIFGGSAKEVDEKALADRTWIACDTGLMAKGIERKIDSLDGLNEEDARAMYGATLMAIGKRLLMGTSGDEIYGQVAGPGSFTGKLHDSLIENGAYDLMSECVRETIVACRK